MGIKVNIPAKIWEEKELKSVRLILDEEAENAIYWGSPSLFSTDLKETQIKHSAPLEFKMSSKKSAVSRIDFEESGSFLNKVYQIKIYTFEWTFFTVSKNDGQAFMDGYKQCMKNIEDYKQRQAKFSAALETLVLSKLKASGKVNLKEFSKRIGPKIKNLLTECYPDELAAGLSSHETEEEYYFEFVREWVEIFIKDDDLSGFINDCDEYIDRDLVIKEQRITQVNVQMDFNSLLQQLGNKGVMVSSIQCPQCKAACTIPHSGAMFNCESCGTQIKVTDVFDKFKGILG